MNTGVTFVGGNGRLGESCCITGSEVIRVVTTVAVQLQVLHAAGFFEIDQIMCLIIVVGPALIDMPNQYAPLRTRQPSVKSHSVPVFDQEVLV